MDATGADTVLNFSTKKSYRLSINCVGNGGSVVTSTAYLYDASTSALIASIMLQTAPNNTSGMTNSTSGTWS